MHLWNATDRPDGERQTRYLALVQDGKPFELDQPTGAILRGVRRDDTFTNLTTNDLVAVLTARLSAGPMANQTVFLFATRVDTTPLYPTTPGRSATTVIAPEPTPAEVLLGRLSREPTYETRVQEIYRQAKAAKNAAKSKAGAADLSTRARVLRHEEALIVPALAKRYYTDRNEIGAIIAYGEAKDGTTRKVAAKVAAADAKFRNDVQLAQIDTILGQQIQATLAAAEAQARAAAKAWAKTSRQRPIPLPQAHGRFTAGHPWNRIDPMVVTRHLGPQ